MANTLPTASADVNPEPALYVGWAIIEPCPEVAEQAEYDAWLAEHADALSEQAEMDGLVESFVRF